MNKETKVKNIMAFLLILFGEDLHCWQKIMDFSPDYLIDKYERYIQSLRDESEHGLHPLLQQLLDQYCKLWHIPHGTI